MTENEKDHEDVEQLREEIEDLKEEVEFLEKELKEKEEEADDQYWELRGAEDRIDELERDLEKMESNYALFHDQGLNDQFKIEFLQENWDKFTLQDLHRLLK